MGYDYALVHLKYTIPPAIALTFFYKPLCTKVDLYKIIFLITVAITATIPWDSYLIRRKVWTYPPTVIVGPTLFSIPAEEVFFFFIQTYTTTLLYLFLSKASFKPAYLVGGKSGEGRLLPILRMRLRVGQALITTIIVAGALLVWKGEDGTYMGLILAWAGPFALFLWSLAYQLLIKLPYTSTALPIALPTLYLWIVDTMALRRGTWSIESGTKLGIQLWDGLEIEEAVFFLVTNLIIVFGLVAFDNSLAILETFPTLFPIVPALPSPKLKMQALMTRAENYDSERIVGIQEAVSRLQKKSRSFYLASSVFSGRLRVDLILLYSFCRVADDLVDNATSKADAEEWIEKLTKFLDLGYELNNELNKFASDPETSSKIWPINTMIAKFPANTQSALTYLPIPLLSSQPLYDLLRGFKTDLEFPGVNGKSTDPDSFPIKDEAELEEYGRRVAGTVAELCLELVFHHSPSGANIARERRDLLVKAGGRMGIALQYVNIARDVAVDAKIGRVYLPTSWLKEEGLSPQDVIQNPDGEQIERLRTRLLAKAFGVYGEAKSAMVHLPVEARAPMRVAVESYMEIGRVLREKGYKTKAGRATVPKSRRIRVAWKALNE